METLQPPGWPRPHGYSNGVAAEGRLVFVAGQIGWDETGAFPAKDMAGQVRQTLRNIVAVLAEAGAKPEHVCRMTAYCCDKPAYLAARAQLGAIWKRHIGRHYPAMSMIFVSDLLDHPGKIELEATAVLPART
jgi:enamine deaminase RidA (YjgF/YER057c/UK114 family)